MHNRVSSGGIGFYLEELGWGKKDKHTHIFRSHPLLLSFIWRNWVGGGKKINTPTYSGHTHFY